jgi:diguanylate cyclase (GGDEF)-like protein/PAS domain S-box-containing protein
MAKGILPRYLLLVSTLVVVVVGILMSMFYGQYRWLAGSIVDSSVEQHTATLHADFNRRAVSRLHEIAENLAGLEVGIESSEAQRLILNAINVNSNIVDLRVESGGDLSDTVTQPSPDIIRLQIPMMREATRLGTLTGDFSLIWVSDQTEAFRAELLDQESHDRRDSYIWTGGATLFTLVLCGGVIWLIGRAQTIRIRELKVQAEKLSDSDFGEPLQVVRGDELGRLADVFNHMRDKLQRTTISRDYVDSVLSNMNEAIIITSSEGRILRINDATSRLLAFDESELLGHSIDLIVDTTKSKTLEIDPDGASPKEAFLLSKTAKSIPVSYTGSIVGGHDGESGDRIYAAQNISERRRAEQRIRYLARIDALTKIPNRMQFQHLLQRAIARAKRSNKALCLLYIDVDRFKDINDTFGHLAGDTTLETVADRLNSALPKDSVIGRLAGDEFAVIVDRIEKTTDTKASLDALCRTLLDRLADPFYVQGHEVFMTASMGIAFYPSDAADVIDLIRNADAAMYHAKKAGGNVFSYYKPEMNEATVERLMTKSKLKRAFERNELLVHYQPKYNIQTGEIMGAEALVRWELPGRGIVLPSEFIPIAEESSLIIEIGEWVLDRVCEDFRYWQNSVSYPGRVSVNLSLKQLRQLNFINRITAILRSYEVSPTSLELEITETTLMENPTRTIKMLDELYSLGLHLAIDDFGTGYSSLSALQQFPISTLKIDQSFVRDVVSNPDDATIVGTIIHMGRALKMDVVAEGVETEDQLNFLQQMDCAYVQGLLFGDPMNADSYLELLLAQAEGTDSHRALFA